MRGDAQYPSIPLGFSPLRGEDAVSQCRSFKGMVHARLGRSDDAWLETVVDESRKTRGFVVRYIEGSAVGEVWARKVLAEAPSIWAELGQVRERVRA